MIDSHASPKDCFKMLYSLKTAATNPSICSNRHSTDADITLVRSGLDFGNAVLMGLPTYLLRRV